MKKSLRLNLTFIFIFTLFDNLSAAPFDTGIITLQQPDQTEFTGRIWGDEFFWWAETEDGYRFIQSGDGWYYYAELDKDGEFEPTKYKVKIDSPPESSYQLERTQERIDEINQQIEQFNDQIELNSDWYAQKQEEAQGQPVTLKVGIILIEFKDFKHYETDNRPDGYLTADFDSMMFSYNYWEGDETVTRFYPKGYHTAIPGYVYGGLIASLIDCHGTGTAALAAYKAEGREIDTLPPFRFVTASLQVDYLKPTPLGVELEIRGKVVEIKGRKVISEITLSARGEITAKGKVVAVQMPEGMVKK